MLDQLPVDYPANLEFPKIPKNRSYGIDPSDQVRFFLTPTPGQANGTGVLGFVQDTEFDNDRGFYDAAFNLVISTPTTTADIRYTTDGTVPTETHGTLYTGPVPISQTTVVRAIAYEAGYGPTNVDTHTYLFAADVIASSVMDTGITQHATYGPQMIDSLKALPIVSLAIEDNDTLGNGPENRTSIEWILADGTKGFQVDAGVTRYGNESFTKESFRIYFRNEYGPGRLNYPLFKGFENGMPPVTRFDSLELRNGSQDMAQRGAYLSNRFTDDALLEMGNFSPHGRFVHVMRNGVYWGQYHLRERWNAAMAADYLGGDEDDYDAIKGNVNPTATWPAGEAYDGTIAGWEHIKTLGAGSNPWTTLQSRVDMQAYFDFAILYEFGGCENEYRAVLQNVDNGLKMRLYLNDADGWLRDPTGIYGHDFGTGPALVQGGLLAENNPDFKIYLADRVYEHCFNDGALTPLKNKARLQKRVDETQDSFLCESARWGYRTPASWQAYQDNLINNQFDTHTSIKVQHLRDFDRYPDVDAPEFNQDGGVISSGFELFLSAPSGGTIHYTTDGSDPRLSGGAINPAASSTPGGSSGSLIAVNAEWKYLDDGSDQGTAWRDPGFNDAAWASGNAQLGYGDGDEATVVSYGGNSNFKHITTYFRKTISVTNASSYTGLTLSLQRDDGAVVYLNGTEIVRSNMDPGTVTYTTTSSSGVPDENAFVQFSIDPALLVEGDNTIAVEIHQTSRTSSDISFALQLNGTLGNPTPDLILTADTTLKARVLDGGTWSALHPADFIISLPPVAPVAGDLVISELHYHPTDPTPAELAAVPGLIDEDFEFIELMNIHSEPLRLDGCLFQNGIDYIFPEDSILQPGGRLVLVNDPVAFALRHGGVSPDGEFSGKLSNSGERIVLDDAGGLTLIDLRYGDGSDPDDPDDRFWPAGPDGSGRSLVMIHPGLGGDLDDPLLWRASAVDEGSPGGSDAIALPGNPGQDLDGDGFAALLEQTLNSSDTNAADRPVIDLAFESIDVVPSGPASYLTLTFARDPLIESFLQVETSSSLDTWLADGVLVSRQTQTDGTELLKYRFPTPASDPAQFMRIRLTH